VGTTREPPLHMGAFYRGYYAEAPFAHGVFYRGYYAEAPFAHGVFFVGTTRDAAGIRKRIPTLSVLLQHRYRIGNRFFKGFSAVFIHFRLVFISVR